MIDGVWSPRGVACDRSVFRGRPGLGPGGRLRTGAGREASACSWAGARRVVTCLRGSLDRLLGSRLAFGGGERCIAQFAQDVVGASAELARDRQAGAVVVDPTGDLQVVAVVG